MYDVTNVLVEGGGRLLGHLFRERLVNGAWVFVAPSVTDGVGLTLAGCRTRGGDVVLRYDVGRG